ncbi:hypothetical protein HYPSUDRAFT_54447 [Hypholoma sublateritium FD-334 SS-4]|uniref:Uncharacterized protein n=1 Tax=Hypholoma sublateritium (strain FD-334 SS-4) TaxID=945553 RepID=A0A0D2MHZ2_HYPSF|nr:hypothetical protein HYPSUDRAFT_54447 [Hypholoma sublateritium FD-334 SS-4]
MPLTSAASGSFELATDLLRTTPFITGFPMGNSGGATPITSSGFSPGEPFSAELDAALEKLANLADKQVEDKQQLLDGQENLRKGFVEAQEKRDTKFREEMLAAQKTLVEALRLEFLDLQRQQTIREDGIRQELVEAQRKREADAQLARDEKEADAQLARDAKEADAQMVRDKKQADARHAQDKQNAKWCAARDRKASDLLLKQRDKDNMRDKKEAAAAAAQVRKDALQAKKEAAQTKLHQDEMLAHEARFATQILASTQISAEVRALTDQLLAERLEKKLLKEDLEVQAAAFQAQTVKFDAQAAKFDAQTIRADKQEQLLKILLQKMDEQQSGTEARDRRVDDLSRDFVEQKKREEENGQHFSSRVDKQDECLASLSSMFGNVQIWTLSQDAGDLAMVRARALVDKMMRATAHALRIPDFTLHGLNGSRQFRRALNTNGRELPSNATEEQIRVDDEYRRRFLTTLLENEVTNSQGVRVTEKDRSPLQRGLISILDSADAMIALSANRHPIRLAGNYHAHSVQSMSHLHSQLENDENYPLDPSSKKALQVFTKFFLSMPTLLPPSLFGNPFKAGPAFPSLSGPST